MVSTRRQSSRLKQLAMRNSATGEQHPGDVSSPNLFANQSLKTNLESFVNKDLDPTIFPPCPKSDIPTTNHQSSPSLPQTVSKDSANPIIPSPQSCNPQASPKPDHSNLATMAKLSNLNLISPNQTGSHSFTPPSNFSPKNSVSSINCPNSENLSNASCQSINLNTASDAAVPETLTPCRKVAKPKTKTGRFSDIHMAQFKKMPSIADHPSAFRANTIYSNSKKDLPSSQTALKRKFAKTEPDFHPPNSKCVNPKLPNVDSCSASPAKRIKRETIPEQHNFNSSKPKLPPTPRRTLLNAHSKPGNNLNSVLTSNTITSPDTQSHHRTFKPSDTDALLGNITSTSSKVTNRLDHERPKSENITQSNSNQGTPLPLTPGFKHLSQTPSRQIYQTPQSPRPLPPLPVEVTTTTTIAVNLNAHDKPRLHSPPCPTLAENVSLKSILRTPKRLYSDDPRKVAAGTHLATPPGKRADDMDDTSFSSGDRVQINSSSHATNSRARHVKFSASATEMAEKQEKRLNNASDDSFANGYKENDTGILFPGAYPVDDMVNLSQGSYSDSKGSNQAWMRSDMNRNFTFQAKSPIIFSKLHENSRIPRVKDDSKKDGLKKMNEITSSKIQDTMGLPEGTLKAQANRSKRKFDSGLGEKENQPNKAVRDKVERLSKRVRLTEPTLSSVAKRINNQDSKVGGGIIKKVTGGLFSAMKAGQYNNIRNKRGASHLRHNSKTTSASRTMMNSSSATKSMPEMNHANHLGLGESRMDSRRVGLTQDRLNMLAMPKKRA